MIAILPPTEILRNEYIILQYFIGNLGFNFSVSVEGKNYKFVLQEKVALDVFFSQISNR